MPATDRARVSEDRVGKCSSKFLVGLTSNSHSQIVVEAAGSTGVS